MTPEPTFATTLRQPPPRRIETPHMLLRCWEPEDAPELLAALTVSVAELGRWTPWVVATPPDAALAEARIAEQRTQFETGPGWVYGIFEGRRVLGSVGLFERIGPGALEIGYWIRSDAAGRGLATTAAAIVRDVAFDQCGADRVEIRCNPANAPSNAIARRLGFLLQGEIVLTEGLRPGESGHLLVWAQERRTAV